MGPNWAGRVDRRANVAPPSDCAGSQEPIRTLYANNKAESWLGGYYMLHFALRRFGADVGVSLSQEQTGELVRDRPKQILGATRIWEESREDWKLDARILTQRILTQRCSGSRANGRSFCTNLPGFRALERSSMYLERKLLNLGC